MNENIKQNLKWSFFSIIVMLLVSSLVIFNLKINNQKEQNKDEIKHLEDKTKLENTLQKEQFAKVMEELTNENKTFKREIEEFKTSVEEHHRDIFKILLMLNRQTNKPSEKNNISEPADNPTETIQPTNPIEDQQ